MKIIDTIDCFIPGDWGNETLSEEAPCKVSCIRGADIVPIENNDFSHIPTRYINQKSFDTKCLQAGDIIVEKSGGSPTQSTGRVSFVSQELIDTVGSVVCSNFCVAFRVKQGWNPLYIYYYLQHVYNNGVFFNFEGKTSGIKNLQLEAAYNAIPIEDVDKAIQDSVVAVLDRIQKKMTINSQINQNLEALAKQFYDYWFVQFDFPNEEGKPYKSSGGKMVWNKKLKKEIPAIWDVKMLRDITKDDDIKQINPQQQPQKVFKHLSFPSFDACGSYFEEEGESIRSNKTIVKSDYVLAAKLNPWIKRVAWGTKEADLICSTEFVVLNPSNSNTKAFLYEMVSQNAFIEYCTTSSTGTSHSQRRVKPDIMKMYQFPYNERVAELFSKHLLPLIEKSFSAIKQNKALVKLRDELLPLLMNGQITIE